MSHIDAEAAKRIAETKRAFAQRYAGLSEAARYSAMKAIAFYGGKSRTNDPLERKMAEQFVRVYEARSEYKRIEAVAAETDSVAEREQLLSDGLAALKRAEALYGADGADEMRQAAVEAVDLYRAQDARHEATERAKALAAQVATDEADEALAARLAPAARVRALAAAEAEAQLRREELRQAS